MFLETFPKKKKKYLKRFLKEARADDSDYTRQDLLLNCLHNDYKLCEWQPQHILYDLHY